ncbi:MAG: DUF2157 domain-containing protein [Planctomycetota bacterium]
MSEREAALAEIAALAHKHGLSPADIRRALDASAAPAERRGLLARALGYLGGTFVFAGLCVFVGTYWDEMNSAARIVVTLGSGIVAFILSHIAAATPRQERLATPLYLIAVVLQPAGILITFAELSTGGDPLHAQLAVSAVMLAQCLLFLARHRRTTPLFFALFFGFVALGTALELLDADPELNGLVVGAACFLVTTAVQRTQHAGITPFWYLVAAVLLQLSLFAMLEDSIFEMAFVALPCALVYFSTSLRSRTLLAAGTLGMLVYIGYFTGEHFADSLGWPIALIVIGFAMMALGTAAVRIHRRYIKQAA